MVKVLLIGNSGVGKSSLLLQYSDRKFAHNYYNTIGVDYRIKFLNIEGLTVKLQVWDTAGQDRFRTITSSYYRGADGIIIVYDVSDRQSFDNVRNWLEEIDKYVDQRTKKYIVGNKSDLEERRQVAAQEGEQLTRKLAIPFRETSARLATNVEAVFQDLIRTILTDGGGSNALSRNSRSGHMAGSSEEPQGPKVGEEGQRLTVKELMERKRQQEHGSGCCAIF